MKALNIEQNTPEWLVMRRSKIGSSDCPIILKKSPYRTPYQLWREKVLDEKPISNFAMQRGSELEPFARSWYSEKSGTEWEPCVFQSEERDWQIASIDGFNKNDERLLEIKCPGDSVFREVESGNIPIHWLWQIQHQFAVTKREKCVLLVFSETKQIDLLIEKDEKAISELNEAEDTFFRNHLVEFEPPDLSEKDYVLKSDPEWISLAQERVEIEKMAKELEEKEKRNRERLKFLSGDFSCIGAGIKLTKYFQKGSVDYSKIPELKTVDLNRYRKSGSDRWRISVL